MFLGQVEAVIFDKDDTWTKSYRRVVSVYKKFGEHKGLRIPLDEEVIRLWGRHIDQIIQGLWPELNGVAQRPVFSNFISSIGIRTPVLSVARSTFRELIEMNLQLGVITSSSRVGLTRSLTELGFDPFLFTHSSDDMPGIEKPDPRVFDLALGLLSQRGVTKEGIVYVGDHGNDFVAATTAGIGFIAVTTGFTPRRTFVEMGQPKELVLTDISQLPGLIKASRRVSFSR